VLPGKRIRTFAERERPGMVRRGAVEILESAPERVPAPCPYFTRCGGCHYQHAPYDYQLAVKRAILAEELRRLGKIEPPEEIVAISAEPWGYRNRTQLHIRDRRIGYWEARSHRLCPIEQCPISSPKVNEVIRTLNAMLHDSRWPRFLRSLEVFTDEHQVQLNVLETERPVARRFFEWCAESFPGFVPGPLDYEERFRVSGGSFFQVNRFLVDPLVETALAAVEGETAVDLYAGIGLFSLALARRFREVTAVEAGSSAVRDLEFNRDRAGLLNIRAEHRTAEDFLARLQTAPDCMLLDPPRAGLGKAVVQHLSALRPRLVVMVSCDPATLARDLAGLTAAGYRIERMALVDMFPQTFHLETVARLRVSTSTFWVKD
jgi:23S rRNA (uracil1939-C5)-methyltransferase